MKNKTPKLITGGNYSDDRGKLDFFNDFDMTPVKRIYFTTHLNTKTIRAWQGHKIESRWFVCSEGSFTVKVISIDDWDNPSEDLEIYSYVLSSDNPAVLYIPNGFVNGFKANQDNSKLMVMSDFGYNEIENDEVRFDNKKWNAWND